MALLIGLVMHRLPAIGTNSDKADKNKGEAVELRLFYSARNLNLSRAAIH